MKKALTWIKNNPYKVLQNVWMLLITLLLGFVVIQQNDIRSDIAIKSRGRHISIGQLVSSIGSDVSSIGSDVSSIESDVSSMRREVSSIESDVSSMRREVSSIESDVSSINMRLLRR